MHQIIRQFSKPITRFILFNTIKYSQSGSGIKHRNKKNGKKPSSQVFAQISQQYVKKYKEKQDQSKPKSTNKKTLNNMTNINPSQQEMELQEIQQLKNSWLGNALEDDLYLQTKEWMHGRQQVEENQKSADKSSARKGKNSLNKEQSQQKSSTKNNSLESNQSISQSVKQQNSRILKVKAFKKNLQKTQLINKSRKFMQIICNIFPQHQVHRIITQIRQFCSKKDLNLPSSMAALNLSNQNMMTVTGKLNHQKKVEKQFKIIQKVTKQRQKRLFLNVRKIIDESITDIDLIDNLMMIFSQTDPKILNNQDIHKLVYMHQQGQFQNEADQHKAQVRLIMDKRDRKNQINQKDQQKAIDELISPKKDYLKQSQQIVNRTFGKKQVSSKKDLDEQAQDLVDVFQQFSLSTNSQKNKQQKESSQKSQKFAQKKKQKGMKLIVKRNINQQKNSPPQTFQITQHSLHQIQRILFKNKKIVQDNVVFKKVKSKSNSLQHSVPTKLQKQREQFGKNWVYCYQLPYSIDHSTMQQFIEYLSAKYGAIVQYYIFSYKNMLQKRQDIMIHIQNQKRIKKQQLNKQLGVTTNNENHSIADKLLDKIQKEKNLKLNKSSMIFKFKSFDTKKQFLMPQMRLYGINFKNFSNVRFQDAQSKRIIALSMIPWGCSSEDLLKAINKTLKPIDVQVSFQACILAKGFIFIEFDNFYESLNACRLLNNLQFQGHNLKVQINYGSSKIYDGRYKSALQFDHYETLVQKLKDLRCYYNDIYKD